MEEVSSPLKRIVERGGQKLPSSEYIFIIIVVIFLCFFTVRKSKAHQFDFLVNYTAVKMKVNKLVQNIYHEEELREATKFVYIPHTKQKLFHGIFFSFVSSPAAVLLYIPLIAFRCASAKYLWLLINALILTAIVFRLSKNRVLVMFGYALLVLGFTPIRDCVNMGQTSLIVLWGLCEGMVHSGRKKQGAAGFFLGATAALKLFPALFLIPLILHRRWRDVRYFVLTFSLLMFTGSLIVGWESVWYWLIHIIPRLKEGSLNYLDMSIPTMLNHIFNLQPPLLLKLSYLLDSLLLGMVIMLTQLPVVIGQKARRHSSHNGEFDEHASSKRQRSIRQKKNGHRRSHRISHIEFSVWVSVMLLVLPLCWFHYYVLLLLPFIVIGGVLTNYIHHGAWVRSGLLLSAMVLAYFGISWGINFFHVVPRSVGKWILYARGPLILLFLLAVLSILLWGQQKHGPLMEDEIESDEGECPAHGAIHQSVTRQVTVRRTVAVLIIAGLLIIMHYQKEMRMFKALQGCYPIGAENDYLYLGVGWDKREQEGISLFRWVHAKSATMRVYIAEKSTAAWLLTVKCHPLTISHKQMPQVVEVWINRRFCGSIRLLKAQETYHVRVPHEKVHRGFNLLMFLFLKTYRPIDFDEHSQDIRTLAAAMQQVCLKPEKD